MNKPLIGDKVFLATRGVNTAAHPDSIPDDDGNKGRYASVDGDAQLSVGFVTNVLDDEEHPDGGWRVNVKLLADGSETPHLAGMRLYSSQANLGDNAYGCWEA